MRAISLLGLALILATGGAVQARAEPVRIAVLDFELNDLTLDPNNPDEVARTASIKPELERTLAAQYGYQIVPIDLKAQASADRSVGYLFDHPDADAELARSAGARWIAVGRVHKASFLFVYLKVHLVDASSGAPVADLIVEVKGPQKKLTIRGVENLAGQIAEAIDHPKAGKS
jgi:hypothetical protein